MTYTLSEVSLMTGYTDRSLRAFLEKGLLHGTKTDKRWTFSEDDIRRFIEEPAILAGFIGKQNALAAQFLADRKKKGRSMLVVLDVEGGGQEIADRFCTLIGGDDVHDVRFSFLRAEGGARVILCGDAASVRAVLDRSGFPEAL